MLFVNDTECTLYTSLANSRAVIQKIDHLKKIEIKFNHKLTKFLVNLYSNFKQQQSYLKKLCCLNLNTNLQEILII